MLNSHCNNNDKKKMKKKLGEKKNMRKKCKSPPGCEPMIYGLIDNRANHYATESAVENY